MSDLNLKPLTQLIVFGCGAWGSAYQAWAFGCQGLGFRVGGSACMSCTGFWMWDFEH